jgi:hypothetical protein
VSFPNLPLWSKGFGYARIQERFLFLPYLAPSVLESHGSSRQRSVNISHCATLVSSTHSSCMLCFQSWLLLILRNQSLHINASAMTFELSGFLHFWVIQLDSICISIAPPSLFWFLVFLGGQPIVACTMIL